MLPARQAPFVAIVFWLTAQTGFLAISRFVGGAAAQLRGPPAPLASTGERVAWFIWTLILFIVSSVLYSAAKRTEREHACQAQRNATIFSGTLLLANAIGSVVTLLALATLMTLRDALVFYSVIASILEVAWYFASTIHYAPLPRLPPPPPPPPRDEHK